MIIAIASFKGGVGKTTTALHIAQYLGQCRGNWILPKLDLLCQVLLDSGDRLQALATIFQMHMPKPIEPIQLLTVIMRLLEKQTMVSH